MEVIAANRRLPRFARNDMFRRLSQIRSRRTGLAYPNGASIAYSYDAASRLLAIDNQTNSGQHKYAYTYDKVGNRKDMTVTSPSGVGIHLYEYDKIYQVTEVDYPPELDYLATDSTFNYDDAGNRTSVIDGSGQTSSGANALNQYTAADGGYYQYDTSGNMTRSEERRVGKEC